VQYGELRLDYVPDEPIVHVGVAMDQNVAKGDDALVFADPSRQPLVKPGKLRRGLATDFEFPFSRGGQRRIVLAVVEIPASGELHDQPRPPPHAPHTPPLFLFAC